MPLREVSSGLSPEVLHESAINMAAHHLTNEGYRYIDRNAFRPVAALVIWSESSRRLALSHNEGYPGLTFPVGQEELPLIADTDPQSVALELAVSLSSITDRLRISPFVTEIGGLLSHHKTVPDALRGSMFINRRLAVMPFKVIINNQPQIPGISWHPQSGAIGNLVRPGRELSEEAKQLILKRFLASMSPAQLKRPPKKNSHLKVVK